MIESLLPRPSSSPPHPPPTPPPPPPPTPPPPPPSQLAIFHLAEAITLEPEAHNNRPEDKEADSLHHCETRG